MKDLLIRPPFQKQVFDVINELRIPSHCYFNNENLFVI